MNGFPAVFLIDDDPLVALTWKVAAGRAGRSVRSFHSAEAFLQAVQHEEVRLDAAVYIDAKLGSGLSGLELAATLAGRGFQNLWIETGYRPESLRIPQPLAGKLKGIIGKDPPF